MNIQDIKNKTAELFGVSFEGDDFSKTKDALYKSAQTLIEDAGWRATYEAWFEYLIQKCKTPELVINFVHLIRYYDDFSHVIPDPYRFLGYFYFRLELNPAKYDAVDNMDEMSFEVLMKAGIKEDLWLDDSYIPEKDPEIIKAVERWKEEMDDQ
ncbi:MAG: hypothetical protein J5786_03090 [Clostridiales bacterium]|nr:hypothetical protein [Clostridiales bacterium]